MDRPIVFVANMHKIKFPTLSFPNKLLNGGTEFYCVTDLMKDEEFEFLFVDLMTFRKCFVDKWKLKLNENFICIYQKSKTSKIKLSTVLQYIPKYLINMQGSITDCMKAIQINNGLIIYL